MDETGRPSDGGGDARDFCPVRACPDGAVLLLGDEFYPCDAMDSLPASALRHDGWPHVNGAAGAAWGTASDGPGTGLAVGSPVQPLGPVTVARGGLSLVRGPVAAGLGGDGDGPGRPLPEGAVDGEHVWRDESDRVVVYVCTRCGATTDRPRTDVRGCRPRLRPGA